jgi:hypothetical protein
VYRPIRNLSIVYKNFLLEYSSAMTNPVDMELAMRSALDTLKKPIPIDKDTIQNQNELMAVAIEILERGLPVTD